MTDIYIYTLYIYIYTHTHTHTSVVCVCVCVRARARIYIYTHTHTHTHTHIHTYIHTVGYARTNVIGNSLLHLFVIAYIEMYVFRDNLSQAYSLEQSYHPTQPFKQEKYNTKSKI